MTRRILLSALLAGGVLANLLGVPALTAEAAPAAGFHALGDLPDGDHDSEALAVSLGGGRIVGRGTTERGDEAFFWSPTQGLRLLEQVAREAGLEIPEDWRLERAIAISHDGGTIAGTGTNPDGAREAWLIVLPSE